MCSHLLSLFSVFESTNHLIHIFKIDPLSYLSSSLYFFVFPGNILDFTPWGGVDTTFLFSKKHFYFMIFPFLNFFENYKTHENKCCFWWCCAVAQSFLTLCDPMDCRTPGFPVLHHIPKSAQNKCISNKCVSY